MLEPESWLLRGPFNLKAFSIGADQIGMSLTSPPMGVVVHMRAVSARSRTLPERYSTASSRISTRRSDHPEANREGFMAVITHRTEL